MCGFFTVISNKPIEKSKIETIMNGMSYRGPDSTDIKFLDYNETHVALGFNRLAIQDVSSDANQPFAKSGVVLVFNGEIYNQQELRKSLAENFGVTFNTTSDTEVVLEMYRAYGKDFLGYMRGMFSIVLIDPQRNCTFVCRDRFGIKPLFYVRTNDGFSFSSDIKSLAVYCDCHKANMHYFATRTLLDPFVGYNNETPFTDINSVEPATYWEINGTASITTTLYYNASKDCEQPASGDEIRQLFTNCVEEHLISDVPVGSALSGGFDSSLISVLASERVKQIKLFSIRIDEKDNESDGDLFYAKQIYQTIERSGVEHIEARVRPDVTIDSIDEIVRVLGSPIYDQRVFVWNKMYNTAKQNGIKVLLNGQGADELWYGYYPSISLWKWFSCLYHENLTKDVVNSYFNETYDRSALQGLYSDELLGQFSQLIENTYEAIASLPGDKNKKLSLYMLNTVLRALLNFEDALSMLNTVEVRVPFLDHRFVEVALAISSERHLLETKRGKDLLKQVFFDKLPEAVICREKSPLPKSHTNTEKLRDLFVQNLKLIKQSPLVRRIYKADELMTLANHRDGSFYGGQGEAMLQILSTWRFGEIFHV